MKNKVNLKKCLWQCFAATLLFMILFLGFQWKEYQGYMRNYNLAVYALLQKVQEKNPNVNEAELMELLNRSSWNVNEAEAFAKQYGIEFEKDSILLENQKSFQAAMLINGVLVLGLAAVLMVVFLKYNQSKDKELEQITRYIEEINQKNYKLEIDSISEDELSILKNEIYKTTVMLKETAENSTKAKNDLKDSLSDISHQLKTPLTSILIMLDNLLDNPDMDAEVRQEFVMMIKKDIRNINFLVQSLLKLSKLDTDTVVFLKEKVELQRVVDAAVQNVSTLCDLKNVEIEVEGSSGEINCDFRWQVEAVTNVLKNCVEYSPENEKVLVQMQTNQVYASISICDYGAGMDEEDQKHIFQRFYKGKNASQDSVGIGLALAKAIIEAGRGQIHVNSGKDGTTFTIKYFYV